MTSSQINSCRTDSIVSHQVSNRRLCRGRLFKPLNPRRHGNYMRVSGVSKLGSLDPSSLSSSTTGGIIVVSGVVSSDVRKLFKAVSEEEDPGRMKLLLDALFDVLDERQLMAALL